MKFVNGWNYLYKDSNRVEFRVRIGKLTLLDLYVDPDVGFYLTLFNFTVKK